MKTTPQKTRFRSVNNYKPVFAMCNCTDILEFCWCSVTAGERHSNGTRLICCSCLDTATVPPRFSRKLELIISEVIFWKPDATRRLFEKVPRQSVSAHGPNDFSPSWTKRLQSMSHAGDPPACRVRQSPEAQQNDFRCVGVLGFSDVFLRIPLNRLLQCLLVMYWSQV